MLRALRTVIQFGTFDVCNYGDLLFPLIARHHLSSLPDLRHVPVSPLGGRPGLEDCPDTRSLRQLLDMQPRCSAALIGGGNIVHHRPLTVRDYQRDDANFLAYSDLWIAPSLVFPRELPIIWNAPGVPLAFGEEDVELVRAVLGRVDYLSVRDQASADRLLDVFPEARVRVVPDTAWDLDKIWSRASLREELDALLASRGVAKGEGTMAIHLNSRYLGGLSVEALGALLDSFSKELSLRVVLVPLGACHDDDKLAVAVAGHMRSEPVVLLEPRSLKQIAACIACSALYVGSSMHGFITASTYGVPGVCIARHSNHKFKALETLLRTDGIIAESWKDGLELIGKVDRADRSAYLAGAIKEIQGRLAQHWNEVRRIVGDAAPVSLASHATAASMLEYQRRTLISQIKGADARAIGEKDALNQKVTDLQTGIKEGEAAFEELERTGADERRALKLELEERDAELTKLNERYERDSAALREVSEAKADLEGRYAQIEALAAHFHNEVAVRDLRLHELLTSKSWKVTKPLRTAMLVVDKVVSLAKKIARKLIHNRYTAKLDRLVSRVPYVGDAIRRGREALALRRAGKVGIPLNDAGLEARVRAYLAAAGERRTKKVVVYTALVDNFDVLKIPLDLNPEWDYVCFTDRLGFEGVHPWVVRHIDYFDRDSRRAARYIKLHPHVYFPEYEYSIWIDANILVRDGILTSLFEDFERRGGVFSSIAHPLRRCVYEEARTCQELNKDDEAILTEQSEFYRSEGFPENYGLIETNLVFRKHNLDEMKSLGRLWWAQICRFSKRDQVSLMYCLWKLSTGVDHVLPEQYSVRNHPSFFLFPHGLSWNPNHPYYRVPAYLPREFYGDTTPYWMGKRPSIDPAALESLRDASIDVVICVHNALTDVKACLASVADNIEKNHRIIVVDDGSDKETEEYLAAFADGREQVVLIRNPEPIGYTRSANKGMQTATAGFVILLNSDTIVSKDWSLKLLQAARERDDVGIVGPLSNAASWQSIPYVVDPQTGELAINSLPEGGSIQDVNAFCEAHGAFESFPKVPLINGFCMGIKRSVFDAIGYFDAEAFPMGYGEEDDFTQRALDAGFLHAIATHCYVFHSKSKSFGSERRKELAARGRAALHERFGPERFRNGVASMRSNPLLGAMRSSYCAAFGLPDCEPVARSLGEPKGLEGHDHRRMILDREGALSLPSRGEPAAGGERRDRLRVRALVPHTGSSYDGSSYVRTILPLRHLAGKDLIDFELADIAKVIEDLPDVLIVQRTALRTGDNARELVSFCKSKEIKLVFELDDDLFRIAPSHPEYQSYRSLIGPAKFVATRAELLTASTEHLARNMREYNSHVLCLPNALDESLWELDADNGLPPKEEEPLGILYMGTLTHEEDFRIVEPALRELKQRYGDGIRLDVVGVTHAPLDDAVFNRIEVPDASVEYPGFVRWLLQRRNLWSIGVAPLGETDFNRCKSHLKYLDYSALGLCTVCSDVETYNTAVTQGVTGFCCRNDTDQWLDVLDALVRDRAKREEVRERAYRDLLAGHTLEATHRRWLRALELCASKSVRDPSSRLVRVSPLVEQAPVGIEGAWEAMAPAE